MSNLPADEPKGPKGPTSPQRSAVGPAAPANAIFGKLAKHLTPVDPLILLVVLALLTTFALPILASGRRAANEAAANDLLRNLPGMQGRFRDQGAPDGRHRFATSFFELAAAGLY